LKINGFDENYVGWGFEDSDLAIRLFRSGIKIMNGRYATNVLHLWHPEFSREAIDKNKELLSQAWSRPLRAEAGVQQHLGIT
jgi:predicted glycosyltransferase involved in capsule biosynthesis